MKKQGRPHNPHPFEGEQVEKVMIACDNILSLSGQGARQYSKIVGIAQLCRDNFRVRYQQSGVLDQGDKVVDVLRRTVVTIFQMWTGEGFFQFEEERKTGHEIEMPHPPGLQNLCRSSVRRDQSADENVGSRTALGTPTPTALRRSAPDKVYGLSGVPIGQPSGLSAVLRPHTIEHFEEAFPFGGE